MVMDEEISLMLKAEPECIFDYYDGPLFYSVRSRNGEMFLMFAMDDAEQFRTWLVMMVSDERYAMLRHGARPVSWVLANPEFGACLAKDWRNEVIVEELLAGQIKPEWLPPDTYRANPV